MINAIVILLILILGVDLVRLSLSLRSYLKGKK
jgi:hypothetical protein